MAHGEAWWSGEWPNSRGRQELQYVTEGLATHTGEPALSPEAAGSHGWVDQRKGPLCGKRWFRRTSPGVRWEQALPRCSGVKSSRAWRLL